MDRRAVLLVSLWIVYASGYVRPTFRDCGSTIYRAVNIEGRAIEHSIRSQGYVRAEGSIEILHDIRPARYNLEVVVKKKILFFYIRLPCVSNFGSCDYDLCDFLDKFDRDGCPWALRRSGIPCMCPFTPATHTLQPYRFDISEIKGSWAFLAYGDYRVTVKLYDDWLSEYVNCYQLEFTLHR